MKRSYIIYLFLLLFISACDNEDVTMPVADFTMSESVVSVNQTVTFQYTGSSSKQVVIYTGDEGHDYELKEQSNSGLVLNKGILTYSYKKPGQYKVVLVTTNYDKEGKEIEFATAEKQITVEDDRTDLRSISLKRDLYNKELLGQINGETILFAIPYKIRISGRDIAPDITRQRMEMSAISDAATKIVNDEEYQSATRYNLTQPLVVKIQAASGDIKQYNIETLRYAIFEDFSINGVKGTLQYSDFNFEKTFISVTLPVGTDISNLVPVFSSSDAKTIQIGDAEQISGQTTVDFTNPVKYTLKTWKHGDEENVFAESEVEVTVTLK